MPKIPKNLSTEKRLAAYTALAAASVAAPAMMPSADAAVVTNNINLSVPATIDGVYLNFVTGGTGSAAFAGWDINPYLTNGVFTLFWPTGNSGGVETSPGSAVYASLSPGAIISAASTFTAAAGGGGPGSTINYQTAGQHILGFQFTNENTGIVNYGYAVINNGASAGFPATIVSYSYENTGAAITVVPEPTSFALFALAAAGAVGVREWRRRKAA